jgi:hypothetical protein
MTPAERPEPLHAYQARPGKTCLHGIRDPAIRWIDDQHALRGRHDITVLPASQDRSFVDGAPEAPDWAWEPARSRKGHVLIDASLEGWPHGGKRTRAIHRFLDGVRVPYDRAVYATQDRGYADAYDSYCRREGIGARMKVLTFDYWVREMARQFEGTGEQEFETRLEAYRARAPGRPYRFLSLNRTLRQTRALFVLSLLRDGLWSRGAVSVGALHKRMRRSEFTARAVERRVFGLEEFKDLSAELRPFLPRLIGLGEILFRSDRPHDKHHEVLEEALPQYHQSWFSVVTETEMLGRPCRITEKALKPLLNFHPLLFFGSPGSLELLRGYGFRTFEGFFHEAYDQKHGVRRRFEMAYREVQRLCALDEAELARLEQQVEAAVIHNARHALVDLPRLFRERFDPQLVRDLVAAA